MGSGSASTTDGGASVPPLVVWVLATFHVTALTVVLVGALHLTGGLGDLLSGLDTAVGLAVYGVLWALTWWTNRRALAGAWDGDGFSPRRGAKRAVVWGGVTGVAFFSAAFCALFVLFVVGGASPLAMLAIGLVGALVASIVGGLVGVALGAVDLAVFRAVGALTSSAADASDAPETTRVD
jgi:hypothetical protein